MRTYKLGAVIAERQIELIGRDGVVTPCTVKVSAPVPDENGDWVCPYEVAAGQRVTLFGMHGFDSMQALILTLKTLDGEISRAAKGHDASVRYLDGGHASIFNP